ncbi:hypothetical protein [Vagococcus salmoninarum]|uniref:hypothetical protein n=1 Tax=Vagococcus salmoninarum TaxID=2739 RepID=UPI003F95F0B3
MEESLFLKLGKELADLNKKNSEKSYRKKRPMDIDRQTLLDRLKNIDGNRNIQRLPDGRRVRQSLASSIRTKSEINQVPLSFNYQGVDKLPIEKALNKIEQLVLNSED